MDETIETLAALVAIDSVNPAYGGPGEAGVAAYVAGFCGRHGIEARAQPVLPGRENVIAVVPGRDRSRRVILEAHMDTVSAAGMTIPPFEPVVRDGRLHGRGACDTKAGLAAMMHALVDLATAPEPPPCDVWLAAVVDEEHAFHGVTAVCAALPPGGAAAEWAIVAEPTDLRVVIATKGVLRFRIVVSGRAAHSSRPALGANAVVKAARLVAAIDRLHESLATPAHPLLGPATGCVSMIAGGVQINIVPEECGIWIDRRLLPGERPADVLAGYRRLIDAEAARDPDFRATLEPPLLVDEPLATAADERIVTVAGAALAAAGLPGDPVGVPYGSDASKLARRGIPSIVLGPDSIAEAHSATESVDCGQVARARLLYADIVRRFGRQPGG
jgi:acetylornithine deacetylase/succinyl-diaminopimelate desuccinylase-like protein